jgi:hypothetical protein
VPLTTYRCGAPFLPPNQLPASNLASNSRPDPAQDTTKPILLVLTLRYTTSSRRLLLTPTPFNLHNCLPTGGFLQTAVSDAPRTPLQIYLPPTTGRIRYSTSVTRHNPEKVIIGCEGYFSVWRTGRPNVQRFKAARRAHCSFAHSALASVSWSVRGRRFPRGLKRGHCGKPMRLSRSM